MKYRLPSGRYHEKPRDTTPHVRACHTVVLCQPGQITVNFLVRKLLKCSGRGVVEDLVKILQRHHQSERDR